MDVKKALLEEHSAEQAKNIAAYAISSPKHFLALMDCFLSPEYRISQRAAWAVCHAARRRPDMIAPYISKLVEQLGRKDVHNAVIRNSLRVLMETSIPEDLHGEVLNACFTFIESPASPGAIKAFSLGILDQLSKLYPDIKKELQLIVQDRWNAETPAFKSRGRKILKAK